MPAKRRFRFLGPPLHAPRRAAIAAATVIVLGMSAAPALADTGTVYYDGSSAAAGGVGALFNPTFTGCCNVGIGDSVMPNLTSGEANTALGRIALGEDTSGNVNTATGSGALNANTTGSRNTADGWTALLRSTGYNNTAMGAGALGADTTGHFNLALGSGAGKNVTTGSNDVEIANNGIAGDSGVIRIGTASKQTAAFLQGVYGKTVGATSKAVVVNSSGRLGTAPQPAAPLRIQSHAVGRLRDRVHEQSVELRRQGAAIKRLRKEVRNASRSTARR